MDGTTKLEELKTPSYSKRQEMLMPVEVNAALALLGYWICFEDNGSSCWLDVYSSGGAQNRVAAFPTPDFGTSCDRFQEECIKPLVQWVLDGCPKMEGTDE